MAKHTQHHPRRGLLVVCRAGRANLGIIKRIVDKALCQHPAVRASVLLPTTTSFERCFELVSFLFVVHPVFVAVCVHVCVCDLCSNERAAVTGQARAAGCSRLSRQSQSCSSNKHCHKSTTTTRHADLHMKWPPTRPTKQKIRKTCHAAPPPRRALRFCPAPTPHFLLCLRECFDVRCAARKNGASQRTDKTSGQAKHEGMSTNQPSTTDQYSATPPTQM